MKPLLFFVLFCTSAGVIFAQTTVRGTVTSAGEPLIGVSVQATGTTTGAVTDVDGSYQISLPSGIDSLSFSYVGFQPHTVFVGNRTIVDVVLEEATEILTQVVVVGYGVQQKNDLTGAVAVVEAKDLGDIPTQNLGQALQGKVAGLQIIPTSGAPGAGAVFRIRGIGTLNDADPLFVVDGMIVNDINFINPRDVESVSVLKDASSTAIYGARGANGVIIVTTKQGSARDGGINVSAYTGSQEVVNTIDLVNATQYATLINEADLNEGRTPRYPNPDSFGVGTNWQDEVFNTAPIVNLAVGFSGGNERSTFNLTADYFRQEGIISGSEFDRFTTRINTTQKIKNWLTIGGNVSLIYNTSDNVNAGGILLGAYRSDPLTPAIEEDGSFGNTAINGNTGNPVATIFYANNESQSYRAVGNVFGEVKFLRHFTFRTNFGLDFVYSRNRNFTPVFEVSAIQRNEESRINAFNSYRRNWLWENTVAYQQTIGQHAFDAIVGLTYQDNFGEFLSGSRENLIGEDPSFLYLNSGEPLTSLASGGIFGGDWGLESYLGRINYTFDNRYLLTLSGRIDGSSRFGESNRYGFFPSVGLGWNLSNEDFWNPDGIISRLKLRGSWGQTGNDRIGNYSYTALVTSGLGAVFGPNEDLLQGSTLTQLANPNIRWEETSQVDLGVELGLFQNKLLLEVDAYRRVTDGVLFAAAIPDYLGASAPTRNISEVLNEGIDLKIEWRETTAGGFTYRIGGNASFIDNEVLKVDDLDSDLFAGGLGVGGQLGTNSRAGFPIGAFFGYELDGVFQNADELERFAQLGTQQIGDLRFRDQNGDGVITADGDRVVLGAAIPDLIVGFNGYFAYGGFDFSFDLIGQFGNEVINAKKMARFGAYNFETSFLDRWTGEGTSNTEPRVTFAGPNLENLSTRFVEDGSYIRLRNIQLGYTLPASLTSRLKLRELRVYVSGTNLWTDQEYSGYNPEIFNGSVFDNGIDRGTIYPIAKTVNVGIDLKF
ncbi:MAG: TonB-dependent receptor [Bacteroidota bacterium]